MSQAAAVFSEMEQAEIQNYLGYPKQAGKVLEGSDGFRINNYSFQHLETALLRISEEGAVLIRHTLAELRCIDQQMAAMRGKAGVVRTGDVALDVRGGLRMLNGERERMLNKLSLQLASPRNPFAAGGGNRVVNT